MINFISSQIKIFQFYKNAYKISIDIDIEILTSQLTGVTDVQAAENEVY